MTRPARVLHVLGALQAGGLQRVVLDLIRFRNRAQVQADVLCLASEPGPLAPEAESIGARVFVLPPRSFARFPSQFLRILTAGNYDAVHVHRSSHLGAVPLVLAKQAAVPIRISHYHNVVPPNSGGVRAALQPALRGMACRTATHIIGVTRAVLHSQFPRSIPTQAQVIHNGIETKSFRIRQQARAPGTPFLIGHAGRFSDAKNQELCVEVLRRLRGQGLAVRLVFAGEGPRRPLVEARARSLHVADSVEFLGWQHDLRPFYQQLDVFLFPSLWEGAGLVLAEAQAAGVPVVASRIGAHREMLCPELRRFCFPSRNAKQAAAAVAHLLGHPAQRHHLGAVAADHAQRHLDIARTVAEVEAIYAAAVPARQWSNRGGPPFPTR